MAALLQFKISRKDGAYTVSKTVHGRSATVQTLDEAGMANLLMSGHVDTASPLVPGVRYLNMDNHVIVFERPPVIKSVTYHKTKRDVPLPWQVYIVHFATYRRKTTITSIRTFWRSTPLRGFDSVLGCAVHPNKYASGAICTSGEGLSVQGSSVAELCDAAYAAVWEAGFNNDLYPTAERFLCLSTYHETTKNAFPQCFRGLRFRADRPFPTEGQPLTDVINQSWFGGDNRPLDRNALPRDGHNEIILVANLDPNVNPTLRQAVDLGPSTSRDSSRILKNRLSRLR